MRAETTPSTSKRAAATASAKWARCCSIEPEGFLYTHVRLEDCDEIIEKTILGGEAVERLLYELNGVRYAKHEEIPFYNKQQRVVLENCGTTDAEDIDEYLAHDGYAAFEKALFEMIRRGHLP